MIFKSNYPLTSLSQQKIHIMCRCIPCQAIICTWSDNRQFSQTRKNQRRNGVNPLRPALHFCGANADYRCDRHSTFVATGLSPHKIASCISANQNCSRPFLRVTVEILLLHQPLKSYKLQYKYFAVFCNFWMCLRNFPKVMADESEAGGGGLRELYADSDSGDEFVGFDAETVRRAETTLNALIESDSNSKK